MRKNRQSLFSRQFLAFMLIFEMVFAQPCQLLAQSTSRANAKNNLSSVLSPATLQALSENDQNWQELLAANNQATPWVIPFDKADPAMDKDPFFLRQQSWQTVEKSNTRPAIAVSGSSLQYFAAKKGVQLGFAGQTQHLRLNLPMTPFALTREYIFLSVNKGSDLFLKAAGDNQQPGEGIFFVNRLDVEQPIDRRSPVPVFFFPLSGQGWTGKIDAIEMVNSDSLVIANSKGDFVNVELKDVETLMKGQQINLMLATAFSAKSESVQEAEFKEKLEQMNTPSAPFIYPAPDSTAAFGLFFTGLTDNFNFAYASPQKKDVWQKITQTLVAKLGPSPLLTALMPETAQALTLPPDVMARLIFVGSVLTGMLAVSVVLKYAHPGMRKKIESLREGEQPKSLLGKMGREAKEILDVFAHVTTTSSQFIAVTFGNSLELFLDRFAPAAAAADHTLVRRFLKNSFYFARDSITRSPVNAKTFFLGAIVMGGVDTSFVFLQYFFVVPWLCATIAPFLDPHWQQKIDHAFDPNNPNTRQVALVDTVRNGVSYLQQGAAHYAMDSRAQVIEGVIADVEAQMRARGKDPKSPANQSLRERMIEEKTDRVLQQRGLPASSKFLFDANSLFQLVPKSLGYAAPADLQTEESFILAKRFGLTKAVLERAIAQARTQALAKPSTESLDAVRILEETTGKLSYLANGLKNGRQGLSEARKARQQLTLLSYEGSIEYVSKYVPEAWATQFSPEAAQLAALYYRQSLYSYLDAEGTRLLSTPAADVELVEKTAIDNVVSKMLQEHPELAGLAPSEALKVFQAERATEFATRLQIEIQDLTRQRVLSEKAQTYTPKKNDWLARRQIEKADQQSNQKLGETLNQKAQQGEAVPSQEEIRQQKKSLYAQALARQVGLHLNTDHLNATDLEQFQKLMNFAESQAENMTQGELEHNLGLKTYLSKLGDYERSKYETSLYAMNFLAAYRNAATEREMIGALSPMQPGQFQALRQTSFVSKSRFITRGLRAIESLTDDQALELGVGASLKRNVPLFSDLWSSHRRTLKTFLPGLTVTYLWNYYAWQLHMPYGVWLIFVATAASGIGAPSQWLNRFFRTQGLKVMDSISSKISFAVPYAWVTFLGMIPMALFGGDANRMVSTYLTDPFMSVFSQITPENWMTVGALAGTTMLGSHLVGRLKEALERRKFYHQAQSRTKTLPTATANGTTSIAIKCQKALKGPLAAN